MKTTSNRSSWVSLVFVALSCAVVLWVSSTRTGDAEPREDEENEQTEPAAQNDSPNCMPLDAALAEISDLALTADGKSLWAVHDEKATLFRLSVEDGSILESIEFHKKKGDFEGVAVVGEKVLIGRSDGELFWVDPKSRETSHFSSGVGPTCDLEGLAWDAQGKRVLLSCKGAVGSKTERSWDVFALDPESGTLASGPVVTLHRGALEAWVAAHHDDKGLEEVDVKNADPSGIAIDPRSGELNLISTRGRLLVALNADGGVERVEGLSRGEYRQPEGIAVAADGTVLISNEARGERATLCRRAAAPPRP